MAFENRKQVIDWLNDNRGRDIVVQAQGSMLKLTGRSRGVDEIDACGVKIYECELDTELPDVHVAMSLHEDTVAIHVLGNRPGQKEAVFSLPLSFPYGAIQLSSA